MAITFSILTVLFILVMHAICAVAYTLAAWSVGVSVTEIGIGVGPALLRRQWRTVTWRLNLFPFGSYAKMRSIPEDERSEVEEEVLAGRKEAAAGTFYSASRAGRLFILFSGPLALVALSVACMAAAVIAGEPQLRMGPATGTTIPGTDMVQAASPSSISGQADLFNETAGYYVTRLVTFQDLDGWGGYAALAVQSGKIAVSSPIAWLTLMGVVALANGLSNLLPIPVASGFQILTTMAAALVGRRDLPRRFTTPALMLGLLFGAICFVRMVVLDVRWIF